MKKWEVRVSFYTEVTAETIEQVNSQIHQLLTQLGNTQTTLDWDDCEWDAVWSGPALELEKN
jgi:hypothetical protein